jgi:glycosyltransferase involved in cell wall biosynthesis
MVSNASKILFIDDRVPHPWLGSGFPRARAILVSLLRRGFFITLYPMAGFDQDPAAIYTDIPPEVEIAFELGPGLLPGFLSNRRGYYDAIIVSRPHNMVQLKQVVQTNPDWFEKTTLIYDAEALFASRDIGLRTLNGETLTAAMKDELYRKEIQLAGAADCVLAVSEPERAAFRKYGLERVHVVGHTLQSRRPATNFPDRKGFLFIGAVHEESSPNGDSLIWFLESIWPAIQSELGSNAMLKIVGIIKSGRVQKLADASVSILGPQDDLSGHYEAARVFIAPTRYAAGIPHKVHEAAAHGLPVVATPVLAAQLQWKDGVQISVAGDAQSFAMKCIELHQSEPLWTRVRDEAFRAVERDCSPGRFETGLDEVFSENSLKLWRMRLKDVAVDW